VVLVNGELQNTEDSPGFSHFHVVQILDPHFLTSNAVPSIVPRNEALVAHEKAALTLIFFGMLVGKL
jgi:hypothetical protein